MPSIATLGNLAAGVLGCAFAVEGHPILAAAMIITAAVLDSLDGSIARRFGVTSEFGCELDSLADMVSFGIAPAVLVGFFLPTGSQHVWFWWALITSFPLCAAWRLARFKTNRRSEGYFSGNFEGLPTTGAGGAIASGVLVCFNLGPDAQQLAMQMLPGMMLLLGFLMLSEFPYLHVAALVARLPRSVAAFALGGLCLVAVFWHYDLVFAGLFWSYAFSGPATSFTERLIALHHARTG